MPDHDTVLYNLAGIEQAALGWAIEGDTNAVMAQLGVSVRRHGSAWATATSPCTSPGRPALRRAAA